MLATNGTLHDALLARIRQLPVSERLRKRTRDPLHPGLEKGE
jgi:hypothetical protein